jgi:hypothetical protein
LFESLTFVHRYPIKVPVEEALPLMAEMRKTKQVGGILTGYRRDKEEMEVRVMAEERLTLCCAAWLEA